MSHIATSILTATALTAVAVAQSTLPGFQRSPWFDELVTHARPADKVMAVINLPADFDPTQPTRVLLYATPNGNSAEQTLGCATSPGLDWHFAIQHVAAQVRLLRTLEPKENLVLACVQPTPLSWPAWRRAHGGGGAGIRAIVDDILNVVPGRDERVTLAAHSGGGSFIWGFLEDGDRIPERVDRIVFLDANYSFSEENGHGAVLGEWLAHEGNQLVVIAYDDREITYEGKKVVGPDGGTFRATQRMFDWIEHDHEIATSTVGEFELTTALDERFTAYRHANLDNKILHTALVGNMNGLLHAQTLGGVHEERWGTFGGPPAYRDWVQSGPWTGWIDRSARDFPARAENAPGGRAVLAELQDLSLVQREARILAEIDAGNVPSHLRRPVPVELRAEGPKGRRLRARVNVLADYLAIGSDDDFVRVPLTPASAQRVADRYGFTLPTTRIVDAIHAAADLRLEPMPLTDARASAATFVQHDDLIASELAQQRRRKGPLVSGIKKDVVITPRVAERADRVAIYGWHRRSGERIQPLYVGHVDTYVDYSHGIRLVRRTVEIGRDGFDISEVLADPARCALVSDEGPITSTQQRYAPD